MLQTANTPNNTGVAIYGDYSDFENLYEALHTIVGNEDEFIEYDAVRMRILGVCYEFRHALMGDRGVEFVDNGIDEEKKRRLALLAPNKNVYLKISVLWPEMLFVTLALNDFLELYAKKQTKIKYSSDLFRENKVIWDYSVAQVRMFQAVIAECLRQNLTEGTYARTIKVMNKRYVYLYRYITQYIDLLNHRFLEMNSEKRLKSISIVAKRIVEQDQEYHDLERQLMEEARKNNCSVNDLRLELDFPEDIVW